MQFCRLSISIGKHIKGWKDVAKSFVRQSAEGQEGQEPQNSRVAVQLASYIW